MLTGKPHCSVRRAISQRVDVSARILHSRGEVGVATISRKFVTGPVRRKDHLWLAVFLARAVMRQETVVWFEIRLEILKLLAGDETPDSSCKTDGRWAPYKEQ